MNCEEKRCFAYGQDAASELARAAPCYDERMLDMVRDARTEKGLERNERNMTAWHIGYLKAYLDRGALLDSSQFRHYLFVTLPGCQKEAADGWTRYAQQRIAAGEYIDYEAAPEAVALSRWYSTLLTGLLKVKQHFGSRIAAKLCNLGAVNTCLHPSEMDYAAKLLSENASVVKLGFLQEHDLLEKAEPPYPRFGELWGEPDTECFLQMKL